MKISDYISVIAILVSVITLYRQNSTNKKINSINLNALFFEKLYFENLTYKIPKAQENVRYNPTSKKLEGTEELESILDDISKKARFFRYSDNNFYTKLIEHTELLSDLYTDYHIIKTKNKYMKFVDEHEKSLTSLYEFILKKYQNG